MMFDNYFCPLFGGRAVVLKLRLNISVSSNSITRGIVSRSSEITSVGGKKAAKMREAAKAIMRCPAILL